jgi:hypothetical protein
MNKILIVGDVHGEFKKLNSLINDKKPEILIVCGDFGYWPGWTDLNTIKNPHTKIFWIDGNHENHWELKKCLEKSEGEPFGLPNDTIIYMPRGSTMELSDGRRILFMGGADSIDKNRRTLGHDWFPEEVVTIKDIMDTPDVPIDIIISHTCPEIMLPTVLPYNDLKCNDPSPKMLQELFEKYHPKEWYFGHWHISKEKEISGCKFFALAMTAHEGWWKWLL